MTQDNTLECPVCGVTETKRKEPFTEPGSVVAHMSSSGGEHKGIGYQRAKQMLEAHDAVNGSNEKQGGKETTKDRGEQKAVDTNSSHTSSSSSPPNRQAVEQTASNPTMNSPASSTNSTAERAGTHALPCGHEQVAVDELPELPVRVTCETCGESYTVRE